jgi:hypothetical protein
MDWKEMAKWSVLMITSGIVTAVAIEFITGYARQQAAQAGRAELQPANSNAADHFFSTGFYSTNPARIFCIGPWHGLGLGPGLVASFRRIWQCPRFSHGFLKCPPNEDI